MTDDFTLDPARTYKPRKPSIAPQTPVTSDIDTDYMDDAACRKLCREELVIAIKANSGKAVVANLANALLDRIDGKPAQSVNLDATVRSVTVNAHISFAEMPVRVDGGIIGGTLPPLVIDNADKSND